MTRDTELFIKDADFIHAFVWKLFPEEYEGEAWAVAPMPGEELTAMQKKRQRFHDKHFLYGDYFGLSFSFDTDSNIAIRLLTKDEFEDKNDKTKKMAAG